MATTPVEVSVGGGTLRGREIDGVRVFRGVPYGASTAGPRRFAAPEPVEPWSGVREATRSGPACPQPTGGMPGQTSTVFGELFGPGDLPWTRPASCSTCTRRHAGRPASRCWSGSTAEGSGSVPGSRRCTTAVGSRRRGDVVVVAVNYRLGVLGFLNLPEVGPCNAGLLDQVAALRWVRERDRALRGRPRQRDDLRGVRRRQERRVPDGASRGRGLFRVPSWSRPTTRPMDSAVAADEARALLAELGVRPATAAKSTSTGSVRFRWRNSSPPRTAARSRRWSPVAGSPASLGGWSPVVDGEVMARSTARRGRRRRRRRDRHGHRHDPR